MLFLQLPLLLVLLPGGDSEEGKDSVQESVSLCVSMCVCVWGGGVSPNMDSESVNVFPF